MRIIYLFLLFACIICYGYSQEPDKLHSFWNEFRTAKHDTMRIKLLNERIGYLYESTNADSAIICYKQAIEISEKNLKKGSELAKRFQVYKANSNRYIGIVYKNLGQYNEAMVHFNRAIEIYEKYGDKKGLSNCYNNKGNVRFEEGQYDKAIEFFLKGLRSFEEIGNKEGMANCYNNITLVYSTEGSYDKALEYNLKSLKIYEDINSKTGISGSYNNMGGILHKQGSQLIDAEKRKEKYDNAIDYYLKALAIFEETGNKKGMSQCYNNIGSIHSDYGNLEKVKYYYLKSLNVKEEMGDKKGMALVYGNLSKLFLLQADSLKSKGLYRERKHFLDSAIYFGKKSYSIAERINSPAAVNMAVDKLYKAYNELGDYKEAMRYAVVYIETRDSLFGEEKTKALTEMETKYQSEKKQLEIEKLGKQRELDYQTIVAKTAENKKQRTMLLSFVVGFVVIITFSFLLFRLFVQKRKANILLSKQNAEILQQKEEISAQRDEIEAQRDEIKIQNDIVTTQKEKIEEIHKEVTSSINYAKRIQNAILPSGEYANKILCEHFILFKPKDIVSGDFYWGTRINEWLIVSVADCTGHGVPGAFMSMLGVSFLNEIVRKKEITKANEILNNLRNSIIDALQQKGSPGEQKDGMDISLLVINSDTNECQWAGANNPLYIIKTPVSLSGVEDKGDGHTSTEPALSNANVLSVTDNFIELKGDKMPIAIYPQMKDFTNHEFALEKGDCVYLFTDGYADQFGGLKGRKFMYKQFKDMLLANTGKFMVEQKEILEIAIEKWRGSYEQIDDITILGLKI